jgi:hypothetical protein
MKFGDTVYVLRGNAGNSPHTPGCLRVVKTRLMSRRYGTSTVRLAQKDPFAIYTKCVGQTLTFDSSMVFGTRAAANKAKASELKAYMSDDFDCGYGF